MRDGGILGELEGVVLLVMEGRGLGGSEGRLGFVHGNRRK